MKAIIFEIELSRVRQRRLIDSGIISLDLRRQMKRTEDVQNTSRMFNSRPGIYQILKRLSKGLTSTVYINSAHTLNTPQQT